MTQTGTGFLEKIFNSLRHPHREPSIRRECIITVFPNTGRRNVFGFSSRTTQLRTADDILSGADGGRHHGGVKVSKLDAGQVEDAVWDMNGALGSRFIDAGPLTFWRVIRPFGLPFFDCMLFVIYRVFLVVSTWWRDNPRHFSVFIPGTMSYFKYICLSQGLGTIATGASSIRHPLHSLITSQSKPTRVHHATRYR